MRGVVTFWCSPRCFVVIIAVALLVACVQPEQAIERELSLTPCKSPVEQLAIDQVRVNWFGDQAALYFTVANEGDTLCRITGVRIDGDWESSAPDLMVMLHETREENGVLRMTHSSYWEVPAGGRLKLSEGALHVMMSGLTSPVSGSVLEAELVLHDDQRLPFSIPIGTAGNPPTGSNQR